MKMTFSNVVIKAVMVVALASSAVITHAEEQRDEFFDEPVTDLGAKKDGSLHHTGGLSWSTGSDYTEGEKAKQQAIADMQVASNADLKTPQTKAMTVPSPVIVLTEPFYPGKTPYTMIADKLVERAVERCPKGWSFEAERMMSQQGQMVLALAIECFN